MHEVELILGLLLVVSVLFLLARKLAISYPILLVLGGLALSLIPGLPRVELEPELVFVLFLPPLLCAGAWRTSWRDFKANLRPISLLAINLVFLTTAVVAVIAHALIPQMPWAAAFALGAIISPPDAVAAAAVTQSLGVPRRITTILEGESLVNDASGLVAYRFAVAAAVTGSFSLVEAGLQFVLLIAGGIAVGFAVGWIEAWLQKQIDDAPIEICMTLLSAFGAYLIAEQLHVSGVLAVVTVGLYHRWRSPEIMSPATRIQAIAVWEMVEFILNGLAFILIGLQLPAVVKEDLAQYSAANLITYAAAICGATIVLRLLWVFPAAYLPRLLIPGLAKRDPLPSWQGLFMIGWTGMRGVVSLAAALALPELTASNQPFPQRELIIFLSFSAILVTLVLQGLSLPFLIHWLGLADDGLSEREEFTARRLAAEAALVRIEALIAAQPEDYEDSAIVRRLREQYTFRLRCLESIVAEEEGRGSYAEFSRRFRADVQMQQAALTAERQIVVKLRNEGTINEEVLLRIEHDLDLEEVRLRV
ncbi:Na+/H+ antiporter [Gloeobacter kilaueensis]|uniref:Na+/H+ antiporter n=1 Tax=Gloeobacter kilaueensis (strain ATCC BAA-2537 / CCAP 1431/1 / ULC 316 / JS1) TaxID=1183438 RepID=U5QD69_GLOK1|nr:Na+/H+ antiporter [Gloeobacter kilaueensis]AGY56806.1 Na+/H+ antiporter [Gloeobacter kilaueensis JS1]